MPNNAQQQPSIVSWWGDLEPPDAEETEMVEELLAAHPLLTMREALTEVRIWRVREEAVVVPIARARRRATGHG